MATTQIPRLEATNRENLGKRNSIRLRKSGKLPAVIYGHKKDPIHVTVDKKAFIELAHRNVHLLEVAVGKSAEPCLIKELQWDHLGSNVVHVDLARVDLNEKVRLEIQVVLTGEPVGAKEAGAFLQQFHNEIEIECLATEIPENIKVDVSHLKVGEHIEVNDIKLPDGVKAITDGHVAIAGVVEVKEEVVAAAEGAAAGAEPEVIGRKLAEGEEGEAGAAPAAGGAKPEAKKAEGKK